MLGKKLKVIFEDVAVPEVHVTDEDKEPEKASAEEPEEERSIIYDTLAVPEIHIKH